MSDAIWVRSDYLRALTGVVSIEESVARNVVEDVAAWRQDARKVHESTAS